MNCWLSDAGDGIWRRTGKMTLFQALEVVERMAYLETKEVEIE
jgi:hypothetical protein